MWPSACREAEPGRILGPPLAQCRRRLSPVEGRESWPLEASQGVWMLRNVWT